MSEFSLSPPPSPPTTKKTHFSSLLLSDLFLSCSFILSHPLYFSYFIFFSPYLFKLLSFLSPLFITTSLLLLALITFSPNLVEELGSNVEDHEFPEFEELEAYKIVFEASSFDIGDDPVQEHDGSDDQGVSEAKGGGNVDGNPSGVVVESDQELIAEVKTLAGFFLHQKEECEDSSNCEKEGKEVKPLSVNSNKVEEQKEEGPVPSSIRSGSKAIMGHKLSEAKVFSADHEYVANVKVEQHTPKRINSQRSQDQESSMWSSPDTNGWYSPSSTDSSQTLGSNLGSFGSMRKEKEWRRTLACKLFEERHNVVDNGGEGMDLLWETYETDAVTKMQAKSKSRKGGKKSSSRNSSKNTTNYYDDEEEDDDDDEDESRDAQLCCLQALKFSAGKMNLGMGRPNLVKISKALKNIGWLHHVGKHGKKGYH